VDDIDFPTLYAWLGEAYWSKNRSRETIDKSIANSDIYVALEDGKMVGFARIVTDKATFAWLCDVYVHPDHRGLGISKAIMDVALENPEYETVRWMLATRDAHGLYEQYGFTTSTETDRWMTRGFNVRPSRPT
jgi:GNAT superfamily N-acetyltransferase